MFQILDRTEHMIMSMINHWVDNNKSHIKVRIFMSSNIIIEKLQESYGAYSGNSCFYNY